MKPRRLSCLAFSACVAAVVVACLSWSSAVWAQGKAESTALALQRKAMEQDYLVSDFSKAEFKLQKAIGTCGAEKCGSQFRARLWRDLGVVQIALGGKEKGIGDFVEALKIDPTIALDPDTRNRDLDAAFAEAKTRLGIAPPPATAPPTPPGPGQPRGGDFEHTPAVTQQVHTALPIYAEYFGSQTLVRVVVRYKGLGMTEWTPFELKRANDKGWGGLIPCADVQQGLLTYYIQGYNANNDHVATGGDRVTPYRVQITAEPAADPPHLPNAKPPTQCADTGDCPPGLPGCKAAPPPVPPEHEVTDKAVGEPCDGGVECKSNRCENGKCVDPTVRAKRKRFWVGISGTFDYSFAPSADDVCKLRPDDYPVNTSNFYCVKPNGADYPSRAVTDGTSENDSIVPTSQHGSDKVEGGGAFGNIRFMVTFDVALGGNFMLGGRLGIVLNRYPGDSAGIDHNHYGPPLHAEVRATYVVGQDAVHRDGFAPYFFLGGGIAPYETRIGVQTIQTRPGSQPVEQDADAWQIAGPVFGSVGGGGRWVWSSKWALLLGVRANAAFLHAFAPSVGPELGVQLGF